MTRPAASPSGPVVVGCSDTESGRAALLFAAEEARLRGAALRIVLAWEPAVDPDLPEFELDPDRQRARAGLAAQACRDLLARHLGEQAPAAEIVTEQGPPAKAPLAASRGGALLVIGSRSQGLLTRPLQGSTTAEVIHRAQLPVVVVPAPEDQRSTAGRQPPP